MRTESMPAISYELQQLFVDQDHDWVVDTIAAVLAWVPGSTRRQRQQPFSFLVAHIRQQTTTMEQIELSWDEAKLEQFVPRVREHAQRLRTKKSVQREHVTELATYGLTFVAISVLMPGRRVVGMQLGAAPDILFDVTPGALRGVESAGRTRGGQSAFKAIRNGSRTATNASGRVGKAAPLLARPDLAEVHLSLWCATPRISIMEQLKP